MATVIGLIVGMVIGSGVAAGAAALCPVALSEPSSVLSITSRGERARNLRPKATGQPVLVSSRRTSSARLPIAFRFSSGKWRTSNGRCLRALRGAAGVTPPHETMAPPPFGCSRRCAARAAGGGAPCNSDRQCHAERVETTSVDASPTAPRASPVTPSPKVSPIR